MNNLKYFQTKDYPAPPYLINLAFSSFFNCSLCKSLSELITSAIFISSDLDSSRTFPGSFKSPTGPAYCSKNLKASHIICKAYFLSSAIVINAITPDCKQSCSIKAVPFLVSRSNEIVAGLLRNSMHERTRSQDYIMIDAAIPRYSIQKTS